MSCVINGDFVALRRAERPKSKKYFADAYGIHV
jgi:hypothetical protein